MTTITHALAPMILVRLFDRDAESVSRWGYAWIALAGAMPDLINPHITLAARMTSWSHGLPFWCLFSFLLLILSVVFSRSDRFRFMSVKLSVYGALAYLLHLGCDVISGGINLLYPVQDYLFGGGWIPFIYWIPLDLVNLVIWIVLCCNHSIGLKKKLS